MQHSSKLAKQPLGRLTLLANTTYIHTYTLLYYIYIRVPAWDVRDRTLDTEVEGLSVQQYMRQHYIMHITHRL